MGLLQMQLRYAIELRGGDRAIPFFRKMAHWYLKAMRVPTHLRHNFQQAMTLAEVETVLERIIVHGPMGAERNEVLADMHIPVPSGPVERW